MSQGVYVPRHNGRGYDLGGYDRGGVMSANRRKCPSRKNVQNIENFIVLLYHCLSLNNKVSN